MKKKKKIELQESEIRNNPFINVAEDIGFSSSVENRCLGEEPSISKEVNNPDPVLRIQRVIVRKERKGHGGKTVTIVEVRPCDRINLNDLARKIKNGLGCGGRTEGPLIILQGDIVDRVKYWFSIQGIKKIT